MFTSDIEIGWMAGILDGEGTFLITTSRKNNTVYYLALIAVVSTDKAIVERCHDLAGGSMFGPVGRAPLPRSKPAYRWSVSSKKAEDLIRVVGPHLICKKEVASILMRLRLITELGAPRGKYGRVHLTAAQIEMRIRLRMAVKCLNHRGTTPIDPEKIAALNAIRLLASMEIHNPSPP